MKNKAARIISMLMAVIMVMGMIPFSVFAADTSMTVNVEAVNAMPGETVEVDITLADNPGISSLRMNVRYGDILTLTKVTYNSNFGGQFVNPQTLTSPVTLYWLDYSSSCDIDGVFATLTFVVSDSAKADEIANITVTYDPDDIYDFNMDNVDTVVNPGSVTVLPCVAGDINSDGKSNNKDATTLARFLAEWQVDINAHCIDVNGDGKVNNKDLTRLFQYLANWDVEVWCKCGATKRCNHEMTEYPAKSATCTEDGNIAYWYCNLCEKYFLDVDGAAQTTYDAVVIAAYGHTVVIDEAVAPTYTTTGLTEGSHCSVCNEVLTKQEIVPVLKKEEYPITYHITNNDNYLASIEIVNNNPATYTEQDGLILQDIIVDGYNFKGWYTSQTGGTKVTEIAVGSKGSKVLYAQWEKVEYTVTFDSPDVPVSSITYTVDKGITLTNPSWFGYTFVGWSVDGNIVSAIKPGTTGNITLHANWTSNRNKASAVDKLADPIVIEDQYSGRYLFVYEIGTIENVPLSVIEYIGNSQGIAIDKEYSYTQSISESFADTIAKSVSNATTKSSSWTLSTDWNDVASATNENEEEFGKTSERTDSQGNVVEGKYYISNSESGTTSTSSSTGGSNATSSKVTNNTSTGLNGSYTRDSQIGGSVALDVGKSNSHTDNSQSNWNASGNIGYAAGNAGGVEGGVTVGGGHSWGDSDTSGSSSNTHLEVTSNDSASANIAFSRTSNVGTENASSSEAHWDKSSTATSGWNTVQSYENAASASTNLEITNAISEAIYNRYSYTSTSSRGGGTSSAQSTDQTEELTNEYASTIEYRSDESTTVKKSITYTADATGYYRLVNAGTVHVFAVVGYDMATNSYFTYTYNVLDEERHEYLDYSKNNANFNDCENAILPFEVPYYVNEFISTVISRSEGLVVDFETGIIEEYNGNGEMVVIPQYVSVDNGDGTFTAVRIRGIAKDAFKDNTVIKGVCLPKYVYEIPESAFEGCTSLEVVIGYGIVKIGANAFKGCTSLKSFLVDKYITELGDNAFEDTPEVSVVAANESIVSATLSSGAKRITLNLSELELPSKDRKIIIPDTTEYFALIGNGSNYSNIQIESNAKETFISNMNFVNNIDTPFKFGSDSVTLSRVSVIGCPGFAMILTADTTALSLYGTVELNTLGDSSVISKNVMLKKANPEVAGKLKLTGDYLLCGEMDNQTMLSFTEGKLKIIDENTYDSMLTSSIITFDGNGGSLTENTKIVYYGQYYGDMPIPTRTGYAFNGWYTAKSGGTKITSDTIVSVLANQTLYAQWTANAYNVKWNTGTGYTISVTRTSSPYVNASTGVLSNGAVVYYGDVLSVTYTASTGYSISSKGSTAITVTGNVTSSNIYATATVNSYTASWSGGTGYTITVKRTSSPKAGAAIGNISSGAKVYYGDVLSITYTKADYYTINAKGATSITVTGNVTSSNIYATATLNPPSGWVTASSVPSGAQILESKWTYTLREYTTSSSSSLSGWTHYNTTSVWSDYGAWSSWQDGAVSSSDSRQVETQSVIASTKYKTVYHYYYYSTGPTDGNTSYKATNTYGKVRSTVTFDSALPTAGSVDGYTKYKWSNHHGTGKYMYVYADDPYTTKEVVSHTYKTQYRYRDRHLIYTYYFYRDLSKEVAYDPTGQANVTNVVKYVKYRAK